MKPLLNYITNHITICNNADLEIKSVCCCSKVKLVCFSFFVFRYSIKGEVSLFFVFRFSLFVFRFSFFVFFVFRFSTFVFRHSNSGRISHFDIQNLILTFELGPNIEF